MADVSASGPYPFVFWLILWFVIEAKWYRYASATGHAARVSCIGNVDILISDQADVSGASCILFSQEIIAIINANIMPDDRIYLFATGFRLHDMVHLIEGFNERGDVFLGLEEGVQVELDRKMSLNILGDFWS